MTRLADDADALAWAVAREMLAKDRFSQMLGLEIVDAGPGRAVMALTLEPRHCNGHGMAHGGCLFTLADTAFAHACNATNQAAVAQMVQITYLRPGKVGDRLLATAQETARYGRNGITDITIARAADGAVIAMFRGHSRQIEGTVLDAAALSAPLPDPAPDLRLQEAD